LRLAEGGVKRKKKRDQRASGQRKKESPYWIRRRGGEVRKYEKGKK